MLSLLIIKKFACMLLLEGIIIFALCDKNKLYQWVVLSSGLATAPGVLTSPTNLVLSLLWFILGYTLIFLNLNFTYLNTIFLVGLFWDTVDMCILLSTDNFFQIQQLVLSGQGHFCGNYLHNFTIVWCDSEWSDDYLSISCSLILYFSFPMMCQIWILSQLQLCPNPLWSSLHYVVIARNTIVSHWAFSFQSSGLHLSFCRTWLGWMCDVHTAFWELQMLALMLDTVAFCLSAMVVALHLNNSTAKAYLCNQGSMYLFFFSRLACCILHLANKHAITLIHTYPSDCGSWFTVMVPEWHLLPHITWVASHLWSAKGQFIAILIYQSMSALQYLENLLHVGILGLNTLNSPWLFT